MKGHLGIIVISCWKEISSSNKRRCKYAGYEGSLVGMKVGGEHEDEAEGKWLPALASGRMLFV
jgi:hypothetical protein